MTNTETVNDKQSRGQLQDVVRRECEWTSFPELKTCGKPSRDLWAANGGARCVCEQHGREISAVGLGTLLRLSPNAAGELPAPALEA